MVHSPYEFPRLLLPFLDIFPGKKKSIVHEIQESLAAIGKSIRQLNSINATQTKENSVAIAMKPSSETKEVMKNNSGKAGKKGEESLSDREHPISNNLHSSSSGMHKEGLDGVHENNFILKSIERNLLYLALIQMKQSIGSEEIKREKWKELAKIVNRFAGIVMVISNIGLLIYMFLVMFS